MIKYFNLLLLMLVTTIFASDALAVNSNNQSIQSTPLGLLVEDTYGVNSLDDFLALTPRKIKEATGEKLSLKETIGLKVAQNKVKKAMKADGKASGKPKSQIVALILAFFLGGLGIHRFYLGYTTIGIIQLLTLGGCGIWALIDLIRIAIGDLGPADGSAYDPEL